MAGSRRKTGRKDDLVVVVLPPVAVATAAAVEKMILAETEAMVMRCLKSCWKIGFL